LDPYSTGLLAVCLAAYAYALWRGLRGDKRFRLYGPVVLVRCERCVSLISLFARARIPLLGVVAIASWAAAMAAGMAMLIRSAVISVSLPPELAPHPAMLIGLPVVNPLIPLWYGLAGLVVAVIVHELAHGVALRANQLPVKSAGALLLALPLGAFVEPGDELKAARPAVQLKVFSAGPFANLLVAALALLILSQALSCVQPVGRGVGIVNIVPGSPAEKAGIKPGDLIVAVDGVEVRDLQHFLSLMSSRRAGEEVVLELQGGRRVMIKLADKYMFTGRPEDRGRGFIGVGLVDVAALKAAIAPLANPLRDPLSAVMGLLAAPLTLPLAALPYLELFYTQPLGGWRAVYALIWVAWMNAAVGLTNALPIVPFDGGNSLRVALDALLRGLPEDRRRRAVEAVTAVLTAVTIGLILAPVVVPRLRLLVPGPG